MDDPMFELKPIKTSELFRKFADELDRKPETTVDDALRQFNVYVSGFRKIELTHKPIEEQDDG